MSSRVVVALRVPGSPERVFRVFTEEVALWWRDDPLWRFTPKSPGTLAFEPPEGGSAGRFVERLPNGKVFEIGEITRWEPGQRLAFGWRQASFAPDQTTEVEVSFIAVGEETRVTIEHRGWDAIPPANAARHGMESPLFERRWGAWLRTHLIALGERTR